MPRFVKFLKSLAFDLSICSNLSLFLHIFSKLLALIFRWFMNINSVFKKLRQAFDGPDKNLFFRLDFQLKKEKIVKRAKVEVQLAEQSLPILKAVHMVYNELFSVLKRQK